MELFVFNGIEVAVNKPEILLVPEFAALWDEKFNKGKDPADPKGSKRSWAFRVFTYIYLMYDWQSPYAEYTDQERQETIIQEQKLTEKDLKDPTIVAAVKKYCELQRSIKLELLLAAKKAAANLILFFNTVDVTQKDDLTGKYLTSAKDVINNLQTVGKAVEGIDALIDLVKKEKEAESAVRGGAKLGIFDAKGAGRG